MNPERVERTTNEVVDLIALDVKRHVVQTHKHAYDIAFEAGYRRALCHFGECLEDMKKSDVTTADYKLAHFQMCTRHEEMVELINNTPTRDLIGGDHKKLGEL